MPQYQVDSERIQSSSAAVATSIHRKSGRPWAACTPISTPCRTHGEVRRRTQFTAVAEQWRAAQQQMEASLESIQRSLTQASTVYADAEIQASRLFAS